MYAICFYGSASAGRAKVELLLWSLCFPFRLASPTCLPFSPLKLPHPLWVYFILLALVWMHSFSFLLSSPKSKGRRVLFGGYVTGYNINELILKQSKKKNLQYSVYKTMEKSIFSEILQRSRCTSFPYEIDLSSVTRIISSGEHVRQKVIFFLIRNSVPI
jgi:prolipoprotein diacylglyceryltransferase